MPPRQCLALIIALELLSQHLQKHRQWGQLQLEQSTIDSYNEASRIASEHKDAVTHKMFQDIIAEEEQHLDTFRTELQNVLDYGEEYLALQSAAGSKHAAKSFGHPGDGE